MSQELKWISTLRNKKDDGTKSEKFRKKYKMAQFNY